MKCHRHLIVYVLSGLLTLLSLLLTVNATPNIKSIPSTVALDIPFAEGSSMLPVESYATLDSLAKDMHSATLGDTCLAVYGHTDDRGHRDQNQILSEQRAANVKRYLERQGIAPWRVIAKGWGERRSRESNETPEGRKANRRVEIVNLGPKCAQEAS